MPLDEKTTLATNINERQSQSGSSTLIPVGPGDKPAMFDLSLDSNGALSCFLSDIDSWLSHRPNNDQLIDRLVSCSKRSLEVVQKNIDLGSKSVLRDYTAWFEETFDLLLPLVGPDSAVLQLACFREQIRSKCRYVRLLTLVDHIEEMQSNMMSAHEVTKGALTDALKAFTILLSLIAVLEPLRQHALDMEQALLSSTQVMLQPISQVGFGASVSVIPSSNRESSENLKVYQDTLCKWGPSTVHFEHTVIFYQELERFSALKDYINCIRASRNFEIIHQSFDSSVKPGNQIPKRVPKLSGVYSVSNIVFEDEDNDDDVDDDSGGHLAGVISKSSSERDIPDTSKGIQEDAPQIEKPPEELASKHQSIGKKRAFVTLTDADRAPPDDARSSIPVSLLHKSTKNVLISSQEKECQADDREDVINLKVEETSHGSCDSSRFNAYLPINTDMSSTQCQLDRVASKSLNERDKQDTLNCICEDVNVFSVPNTEKVPEKMVTERSSLLNRQTSNTSKSLDKVLSADASSASVLQDSTKNLLANVQETSCQADENEIDLQGGITSHENCEASIFNACSPIDSDGSQTKCQLDRIFSKIISEQDTQDTLNCICEDLDVFGAPSTEKIPEAIITVCQPLVKEQTSDISTCAARELSIDPDPVSITHEEKECQTDETEEETSISGRSISVQCEPIKVAVNSAQQKCTTFQEVISGQQPEGGKVGVSDRDKLSGSSHSAAEPEPLKLSESTSIQFLLTGGNAEQHERMLIGLQKFLLRNKLVIDGTRAKFKELLKKEKREHESANLNGQGIGKEDHDDGLMEHGQWVPQVISLCESRALSTFRIKEGAPLKMTRLRKSKLERCRIIRSLNRQHLREEAGSFAEAHVFDQVVVVNNQSDCGAFVHRCPNKPADGPLSCRSIRSRAMIRPTRICRDCFNRRKKLWSRQKALRDEEAETFLAQKLTNGSACCSEVSGTYQKSMENIEMAKINVASKRCSDGKIVAQITTEFPIDMIKQAMKDGENVKFVFDIAVPENLKSN